MENAQLESLLKVLQASISPMALISGVGLLLLSLSNRFGRVTDRLRELSRARGGFHGSSPRVDRQVTVFLQRAHILRQSINCAVGCVLFASVMVLCLFVLAQFGIPLQWVVLLLFSVSLVCLIVSVGLFLWDMHLSLVAVQEELRSREQRDPRDQQRDPRDQQRDPRDQRQERWNRDRRR
jgi:hypothetical protein